MFFTVCTLFPEFSEDHEDDFSKRIASKCEFVCICHIWNGLAWGIYVGYRISVTNSLRVIRELDVIRSNCWSAFFYSLKSFLFTFYCIFLYFLVHTAWDFFFILVLFITVHLHNKKNCCNLDRTFLTFKYISKANFTACRGEVSFVSTKLDGKWARSQLGQVRSCCPFCNIVRPSKRGKRLRKLMLL